MSKQTRQLGMVLAAALMAPSLAQAAGSVDSWAFVGKEGTSSRSTGRGDTDALRSLAISGKLKGHKGDFLWFRRGDDRYVVTDAALLAPLGPLAAEQSRLGKQQGQLGAEQGKLGAQQGELGMQQAELGGKQAKLSHQIEKRAKHDEPTAALEAQMQALEREQEALSHKQGKLGERQEPLARQQEKLGAQQEKLAADFEARLSAVIEQALAKGLAQKL
jgi:bla regulator protein BlaR1